MHCIPKYFIITILFLWISTVTIGQTIQIDSSNNVTTASGDDLFPKWSADDKRILYQSHRNGNWDIFIYDIDDDSSYQLTNSPENEQHPIWKVNDNAVVYDSDAGNEEHIYMMDLGTLDVEPLFDRRIQAREPSFPESELLVYFSGFDDLEKRWKIFSYEFLHNNLNQLTKFSGNCYSPKVSKNGSQVLFMHKSGSSSLQDLKSMNWYGTFENDFAEFRAIDASLGPNGLKIYFVSKLDHIMGEIYSIWLDGSHLERLTTDEVEVRCPVVSNNGKFLAISVRLENGYDLYVIPIENY